MVAHRLHPPPNGASGGRAPALPRSPSPPAGP
jgi:hypothetical protein